MSENKVTTTVMKTWLDELIDFYDFVWKEGLGAHGSCVNRELMDDFAAGGNKFEEMKKLIVEKFPNEEVARQAFKKILEAEIAKSKTHP